MLTVVSYTEQETERLGERIAVALFPGAVVALAGDLGAGKTAFARGVGNALGIKDIVSPTFAILHVHDSTTLTLVHVDAYRLQSAEELYDVGFEEYLQEKNCVILVEWPAHVIDALPESRLNILIEGSGMQERVITCTAHGAAYEKLFFYLQETKKRETPC